MNKRTLIFIGVALLFLVAVFFFRGGGSFVGEGITIYRLAFGAEKLGAGHIAIPFVKTNDTYRTVNVAIDLNGDGKYERYTVPGGGTQEEWLVQNFAPEIVAGEANRFPLTLPDRGVDEHQNITGIAVFSRVPLTEGWWGSEAKGAVSVPFTIAKVMVNDLGDAVDPDPSGKKLTAGGGATAVYAKTETKPATTARETPAEPGVQGSFYARHDGVADTNQKYNECSVTAVANSFEWLATKYGFRDRLPGDKEGMIDELKSDMNWDDGTYDEETLAGKHAFIKRHKLPLEAHAITGADGPDMLRKVFDEMKKGQAVEVALQFYDQSADGTYAPGGAHMVTVVGAASGPEGNFISFHDSATKGDATGGAGDAEASRDVYKVSGNEVKDFWGVDRVLVRGAVAQSPTQEIIDGTWVDPRKENTLIPGTSLAEPDDEITRSFSRFAFFSISLENPADHLVGETFPVSALIVKRDREQSMGYRDEAGVRHTYTHGVGSPWSLTGIYKASDTITPTALPQPPGTVSIAEKRLRTEAQFTCTKAGPAFVEYDAQLAWPRTGGEPPANLLSRYAAQLVAADRMTVRTAGFMCKQTPEQVKQSDPRTAAGLSYCPGVPEDPNGKEVEVLRIENECYPTFQLHVGRPDVCKKDHWHGTVAYSLRGVELRDPNPGSCGYGTTDELRPQKVKISEEFAAKFLGGKF